VRHHRLIAFAVLSGLLVLSGPGTASVARPDATIMGFGFRSFRSPDVHKPVPKGSVKPGGTLRGCSHQFHAYIAFRHMRRGLRFALRMEFAPQRIGGREIRIPPVVEHFHWRFTSEVTGRPIYPPDFHVGYPFGRSLPLEGDYVLTVKIAGRKVARGGVTVVSTC
jgi:hypothetical protein